jgi:hypothetical protein
MGLLNNIIPGKTDNNSGQPASNEAQKNEIAVSKYEGLRPLVRSALMKDEVSEKTLETLRKKAESLGMDADEFEIFFDGLLTKKKKAGKKPLLGKGEINYDKYFEKDFDNDFNQAFLTEEEQAAKKGKASEEKSKKIEGVVGAAKSLGKLGAGVLGMMGVVPSEATSLTSSLLDDGAGSKPSKKTKNEDFDDFDDDDEDFEDDEEDIKKKKGRGRNGRLKERFKEKGEDIGDDLLDKIGDIFD